MAGAVDWSVAEKVATRIASSDPFQSSYHYDSLAPDFAELTATAQEMVERHLGWRSLSGEARGRYDRFETMVRLARYGTDCYAFAMLAAGSVDIVADPGLKPYDIVALIPIIEKAGGVITTFEGGPAEKGGDIVAAATPELHAAAMAALRG